MSAVAPPLRVHECGPLFVALSYHGQESLGGISQPGATTTHHYCGAVTA